MEAEDQNKEEKEGKKSRVDMSTQRLAMFALDFAAIIAVPLLALIYLGKWLDGKYGTEFFVIIGILSAILISVTLIYRRIKDIKKDLK